MDSIASSVTEGGKTTDLLWAVAEQLKIPLTSIARQAELVQISGQTNLRDIMAMHIQAASALSLVDSYMLGLEILQKRQTELDLEPVAVSSVLVDVAYELQASARLHNVDVDVVVDGKYGPVMANKRGLKAALLSLGNSLVEASASDYRGKRSAISLATHKTQYGIVAGVYGEFPELQAGQWRKSLELCGKAGQPLAAILHGSAAGLFVAEAIFGSMSTNLRIGRHDKLKGLAATFNPSQQMQLV